MEDTATTSGNDSQVEETPNQRQARLRREKMKKRIAEQGEDRLNKIKSLNGGVAPPTEALGGPAVPPVAKPTPAAGHQAFVEDPDEVDIGTLSGTGTPKFGNTAQSGSFPAGMGSIQQQQRPGASADEDPMVQMMQQLQGMMGGFGGNPQDPNAPNQQADMLQNLLKGGGMGGMNAQAPPASSTASMWRIIHAVFAFSLAAYISLALSFNGSKLSRSQIIYTEEGIVKPPPKLLWIFVTAELGLQSVRYFLEKGQLQGGGMLATVANSGFVPEPYAHYIRVAGRYLGILQTIVADLWVMIFVFGVVAWWSGMAEA